MSQNHAGTLALKLPTCRAAALYDLLESRLRDDATLKRVVKEWRSWQGTAKDRTAPTAQMCPFVRLTPESDPLKWWAVTTLEGRLTLRVDVGVPGNNPRDVLNLWDAVCRAMYPADAALRLAFHAALRAAGGHTGQPEFTQAAFDDAPGESENVLTAVGRIAVAYRFDLNPTSPGL